MNKPTVLLFGLLVITNAAWVISTRGPEDATIPEPARPSREAAVCDHGEELAALRRKVRELESARVANASGTPPPAQRGSAQPGPGPSAPARADPKPAGPTADERRLVAERVAAWKVDVLQIEDGARREVGLSAIGDGIRSSDATLATAALQSLSALRDANYDKTRFREAVRSRLEDPSRTVRRAAAYALLQVKPEPADAARMVEVLASHPEDTGTLIVAAWLAKSRVEGKLAEMYASALAKADVREAVNLANQLRGMWVAAEVETAAVEAYRRRPQKMSPGLWYHILGQIRPTREPRLKLLFEILATSGSGAPQLLGRALEERNLDPGATEPAAALALETLTKAPNAMTRRLCLRVLRESGTVREVDGLRKYAGNEVVAEALRKEAAEVADAIEAR